MIYQIIAAAILTTFFIIFFGKMIAQKRRGTRTSLLRRGDKSREVFLTELALKISVFATITAQILSIWFDTRIDNLPLRIAGAVVGIAGVTILGIAVRTMRDNWRTEIPEDECTQLVTNGIFRISRNPAFLGFDLMFVGLAAMFFNPVLAVLTALNIVLYHLQILREERFLKSVFGAPYIEYMSRTRRYFGVKTTNGEAKTIK